MLPPVNVPVKPTLQCDPTDVVFATVKCKVAVYVVELAVVVALIRKSKSYPEPAVTPTYEHDADALEMPSNNAHPMTKGRTL